MLIDRSLAHPRCCIFIPLYKLDWSGAEHASIRRCISILRVYHILFVRKESIDAREALAPYQNQLRRVSSWTVLSLPDCHFASVSNYSQLLLSPFFYGLFSEWDYVLVFQHDAWIIGGDLGFWLQKGYSYIGAPWCPDLGTDPECPPVSGVGNGGLSLRNVRHMKRIVSSVGFRRKPVLSMIELISAFSLLNRYRQHSLVVRPFVFIKRFLRLAPLLFLYPLGYKNSLAFLAANGVNEDIILGFYAQRVFKWLSLPDLSDAASFSLETNPREVARYFCVDTPFGCHAWEKYNKEFFLSRYRHCFIDYLNLNSRFH